MKSVGERIRQAREARKMSGEALAKKVGYKHQSAIGNLENRPGGTGGNKISEIAETLEVPLEWLLRGPDGDKVPTTPAKNLFTDNSQREHHISEAETEGPFDQYLVRDATQLMNRLSVKGKRQAMSYIQFLHAQEPAATQSVSGENHPLPRDKAA